MNRYSINWQTLNSNQTFGGIKEKRAVGAPKDTKFLLNCSNLVMLSIYKKHVPLERNSLPASLILRDWNCFSANILPPSSMSSVRRRNSKQFRPISSRVGLALKKGIFVQLSDIFTTQCLFGSFIAIASTCFLFVILVKATFIVDWGYCKVREIIMTFNILVFDF